MKRLFLIATVTLLSTMAVFAQSQSFAYLYSEKVFKSMPEYTQAMTTIEEYAKQGSETSKAKLAEVESMFKEFRSIEGSLSPTTRDARKAEIIKKEKEANAYQEEFFGEEGMLAKRQQELMKPIETKVLTIVNAIAAEKKYDMIFDLSTAKVTIYQNPALDITEQVINRLK